MNTHLLHKSSIVGEQSKNLFFVSLVMGKGSVRERILFLSV